MESRQSIRCRNEVSRPSADLPRPRRQSEASRPKIFLRTVAVIPLHVYGEAAERLWNRPDRKGREEDTSDRAGRARRDPDAPGTRFCQPEARAHVPVDGKRPNTL